MRLSSYPLTRVRSLAPEAFRRWVLSGISVAIVGYGAFAVLDVITSLPTDHMAPRHAVVALFCAACLLIAIKRNEVLGCTLSIAACWLEVQTSFLTETGFPAGGMLIVPVLVLSFGLLYGTRAGLAAVVASFVTTYLCFAASPGWTTVVRDIRIYWLLMYAITLGSTWAIMMQGLSGFTHVFDAMVSSRKELADALQFAPDGIVVIDERGCIQLVNPAAERILQAQGQPLVGQQFTNVISALVGEAETLQALAMACGNASGDVRLTFRTDPVTHVEAGWRAMDAGRHQLRLHDVTARVTAEEERQAMEAQLAHAQRMDAVGRLAGGLSHDFNNILTAVSGSAELLRRARTDAERQELIDEIIDARDRGTSLTRQLLSFSRRDVRQPRVLDVADAVRGMERLLHRVAGERHAIHLELEDDCRISVDPGQLEHALVNLIANARDAMPGGGTCTVRVQMMRPIDGAPQVYLTVCDTGTGMSEEVAARAFEPFFTTKARGQGTGLGLASVHAMVTQCNGTARIESTLGHGTCIHVELPAVLDDVSEPSVTRPVASLSAGSHRILVAEDDSGTRRVVERLLTSAGYQVHLCANGREAMAAIDANSIAIDLVLSDIMMPGHTGPEVAARVAEVRPGTPVLLMSGYAEDNLGGVLTEDVRYDVITKPFSGAALTARIAEMIRAGKTVNA